MIIRWPPLLPSDQLPAALSIGAGCPPPKLYTRYEPWVLAMALASSSRASACATGCPVLVASVRHSVVPTQQAAMRRKAAARDGTVRLPFQREKHCNQHSINHRIYTANLHNSCATV